MKKTLLTATLLLACGLSLQADEIDSNVIHDYSSVEIGYAFLNDVLRATDAHGVVGGVSYEVNNFVVGVQGDYFVGSDDVGGLDLDLDAWSVGGNVGYVIRLAENHVNIIPQFGASYNKASLDLGPFSDTADATVIAPGIAVSYAFNNYVSVAAGYTFSYDLDAEEDGNGFQVGSTVALCKNVGMTVTGLFDAEDGFAGVIAALSYHF